MVELGLRKNASASGKTQVQISYVFYRIKMRITPLWWILASGKTQVPISHAYHPTSGRWFRGGDMGAASCSLI